MRKKALNKTSSRRHSLSGVLVAKYGTNYPKAALRHAPKELESFTKAFQAGVKKARTARSNAELRLFDPPLAGTGHKKKSA